MAGQVSDLQGLFDKYKLILEELLRKKEVLFRWLNYKDCPNPGHGNTFGAHSSTVCPPSVHGQMIGCENHCGDGGGSTLAYCFDGKLSVIRQECARKQDD